jgi:hypothetical protein
MSFKLCQPFSSFNFPSHSHTSGRQIRRSRPQFGQSRFEPLGQAPELETNSSPSGQRVCAVAGSSPSLQRRGLGRLELTQVLNSPLELGQLPILLTEGLEARLEVDCEFLDRAPL